jgi:hypothetical protein
MEEYSKFNFTKEGDKEIIECNGLYYPFSLETVSEYLKQSSKLLKLKDGNIISKIDDIDGDDYFREEYVDQTYLIKKKFVYSIIEEIMKDFLYPGSINPEYTFERISKDYLYKVEIKIYSDRIKIGNVLNGKIERDGKIDFYSFTAEVISSDMKIDKNLLTTTLVLKVIEKSRKSESKFITEYIHHRMDGNTCIAGEYPFALEDLINWYIVTESPVIIGVKGTTIAFGNGKLYDNDEIDDWFFSNRERSAYRSGGSLEDVYFKDSDKFREFFDSNIEYDNSIDRLINEIVSYISLVTGLVNTSSIKDLNQLYLTFTGEYSDEEYNLDGLKDYGVEGVLQERSIQDNKLVLKVSGSYL